MRGRKMAKAWIFVAIVLSIIAISNPNPGSNIGYLIHSAGFFHKTWGVVLCFLLGSLGAKIGDVVRLSVGSDGSFFWMIGPQAIGLIVGCGLGIDFAF